MVYGLNGSLVMANVEGNWHSELMIVTRNYPVNARFWLASTGNIEDAWHS